VGSLKKCKICKTRFEPKYTSFQKTCNQITCIAAFGKQEAEKLRKAKNRSRKKAHKEASKAYWLKRVQTEFNRFIRNRDELSPCISCQKPITGQAHAGHYRSVGAHPELRFDEKNCHRQCAQCNNWKSGNLTEYRSNLIKKIGLAEVERLEGSQKPRNYTIPELRELLEKYKASNGQKRQIKQTYFSN